MGVKLFKGFGLFGAVEFAGADAPFMDNSSDPADPTTWPDSYFRHMLGIQYSFGKFGLTLTNYSFPGEGGAYADGEGLFEGDYLEISGSAELGPINLLVGYFTEVEALYVEAAFSAGPVDVSIGYGDDSKEAWYVNGGSGLCNISLGGSKDVKITEDYTLPLFGSFVYNPDSEAAFLVFGASF